MCTVALGIHDTTLLYCEYRSTTEFAVFYILGGVTGDANVTYCPRRHVMLMSSRSQQYVSAAVVYGPTTKQRGNPHFVPSPKSTSLEISTPKCAQLITLLTLTRVHKLVTITQPLFPPRMGENANSFSSFPFHSFFIPTLFLLTCNV